MAKILIDAGHGLHNKIPNKVDPGAVGNDTTEHAEASDLRRKVSDLLQGRCEILFVPAGSLAAKRKFVDDNLKTGDVLLSLHLNAGVPAATGVEVLYDDGAPANAEEAADIAEAFSKGLGLKNRGAKKDTQAAVGNVLILGGKGRRYLIETAFISNVNDLNALRAHGAATLEGVVATLMNLNPAPSPNPEFEAAWEQMRVLGIYSSFTKKTDIFTADRMAVILSRVLKVA